jgi:PAS domain S-box-containing protein
VKRVLVVDGDAPSLAAITRMLADAGYQVTQALDGAHAIREASGQRPDLVLLSVDLPDMTGLEVLRQLKAVAELAELPVVLLGPAAGAPEQRLPADTGADDFIDRPFSVQTLLARVRMLLRHREGGPQEQNAAMLRIACKVARLGGWTLELPQRTLSWSDENCAIHEVPAGYLPTFEEGIGLFAPEHRAEVLRRVQACERDGTPYDIELPKHTAKGRQIWVRSIGEAVRDAQGRIIRLQGAFQDISDRKRAEEALRANEARFRTVVQSSWDVFQLVDPGGRIAYESPSVTRVLGYVPQELVGRNVLEFVHPDDAALMRDTASVSQQPGGGGVRTLVLRVRHKDGTWRWVESYEVDLTDNPDVGAVAVNYRDITERRAAEEALRESEERFRLLALSSNDAILDWDISGDTVWWNEGFELLTGDPRGVDSRGSEVWSSRLHPQDRDRIVAGIGQAVRGSRDQWADSYRFQRRDGSYADISGRAYLIRDAAGVAVRMIGSMTDVTGRLALEEQLRQSQKLELIGQLTGGVAHDFNNLLTVILGNAEILSEQLAGNARLAPLADMAVEAAQRGAELTQRLLAFARRQALEPKALDVNQLVAGMDALLRRTLGEHIEIGFAPGAGLWRALVDPVQLESALLNLCLNARDAMAGGGQLTIKTANSYVSEDQAPRRGDALPGHYVMLSVSDTGTGIAPEHLSHVFEPFFTTKETGKGTGLGLAMIYGFVKQSGGHVNVDSESGHGTTVRLCLPRALQAAAPARPAVRDSQAVGGSESVLLVEDDELVRRYAYDQLVALGYQVRQAHDGAQALEVLGSDIVIDLLFTDVVMPGMSGRQLADRARALRPALKVLYASGYAENEIVHHGRLDPGTQLLAKPYRRDELARRIREILDQPA